MNKDNALDKFELEGAVGWRKQFFKFFMKGRIDMNRNEKQSQKMNRLMIEGKKESSRVSDFSEESVGDGTERTVRQRMCRMQVH